MSGSERHPHHVSGWNIDEFRDQLLQQGQEYRRDDAYIKSQSLPGDKKDDGCLGNGRVRENGSPVRLLT
jgi:hypothetical protein